VAVDGRTCWRGVHLWHGALHARHQNWRFKHRIKAPLLGLFAVLLVMFFWWKDVLFEAVTERVHTDAAMTGLRYGMALFIASEVMFSLHSFGHFLIQAFLFRCA
jgi:hypothetical protein